jgi:hypothetical protein
MVFLCLSRTSEPAVTITGDATQATCSPPGGGADVRGYRIARLKPCYAARWTVDSRTHHRAKHKDETRAFERASRTSLASPSRISLTSGIYVRPSPALAQCSVDGMSAARV